MTEELGPYGPEYPKIQSLWRRASEKPHNVLVGEFTDPIFGYLWDTEWVAHEKVDGTNIRLHWDGHRMSFGGRTDRAQLPPMLLKYLQETYGTPEFEQVIEAHFGEQPVTIYGEGYGAGIQKGGAYRPNPSFAAFDLLVGETWWQDHLQLEDHLGALGIQRTPCLHVGPLPELLDFIEGHPHSVIAEIEGDNPDHVVEGVVARPTVNLFDSRGRRVMVKLKVKDLA